MNIDVSIVLATVDRAASLKKMLSSLKEATKCITFELIVIEGESSDNTSEVIAKFSPIKPRIFKEIEYLGSEKHSWAQLYNFGFSKAVGKWVMYASDDITFSVGCFSKAILELDSQGNEVAGGIFFWKNAHTEKFSIHYTYGQKLLLNYGLIRLDYFKKVGGLDESYIFYCADGDLCLKLYEEGKQFIPLPGCFVKHYQTQDHRSKKHRLTANKDIQRYKEKWRHFVDVTKICPKRYFGEALPKMRRST